MNFKEKIQDNLKNLPEEWKKQLTELLLDIQSGKNVACEDFKECETETTLSPFEVDGSVVSITYRNEKYVSVTRSFDLNDILGEYLNKVDPKCLTSKENWINLTYLEKIQLLVDNHCDCCQVS